MQPATELGPPPGLSRRKSKAKGAHTPGTRRKPAAPASEGGVPTAHAEGSAGAKDVANSKSKPSKKGRQQRTQKGNGAKQPAREQQAAACVPQKEKGRAATPAPRRRNRKPIFKDYIEGAALEQALAAGTVYKAVLRVNAGDRTQGFCTIPGLPNDIFLRGWKVQNRAIEGDTVAIRILPTSSWFRMGGKPTEGERRPRCKASTEVATPSTSSSGNILLFASQARGDEEEGAKRALAREMTPPVWATVAAGPAEHPSDGVVASPALMPSPSGGELGISMEQDPWEVLEEGEAESSCAAEGADAAESPSACAAIGDDDEGGDGEAYEDFSGEGSMLSFVASMANAKISDPAPALCTPTPAEPVDIAEQPWAAAGSAVEATEVLARLLKGDWDGWRATAEVVAIVDPSPRRSCVVGVLRADGNNVIWDPCDPRLPRAFVKDNDMPSALRKKLLAEAKDEGVTARTLVCGTIASWNQTHPFPTVVPNRIVGRAGGLQAEVAALLTMERVEDDDQFTPEILQCLPTVPWSISEADVGARKDLRSQRIFSIDPPTARDLDDALSIEVLDGGLLRIGVHIADVSHFVKPGSALDEEAASRSTSVYLVDRVVPMLPRLLCEELCSLNPGVDRLAVSIIWDMTEEGDIQDMWIGKTIICSCAKLSYPMVQEMIEGDGTLPGPDAPPPAGVELHCGQRWADVVRDSLMLHKVASNLRRRRFADGALRLDNARLFFHVNEEGMPVDFGIYEQKEANRLVEEFMLAANMSAARVIAEAFPDRAMLRCHPPPNAQKMLELAANVKVLFPDAPHLDVSSSGALQQSLHALRNALGTTAPEAEVVTLLCTKPMQNARYFCTGDFPDPDYWRHYALAVTHYTHFTSPIRRYPDVVVHRLLMAAMDRKKALDHPENCTFTDTGTPSKEREGAILSRHGLPPADAVSALAARANERKMCAKAVQDGALQLYLTVLLLNEPRVAVGVISVLGGSRFVDVYVPAFGIDVRVHVGGLLCGGEAALSATWNAEERCLQLDRASTASAQACEPNFHDIENAAVALNPENLPRMKLPVTLRPLGRVTLLVGAKKSKTSGSPAGIHAKLWIE